MFIRYIHMIKLPNKYHTQLINYFGVNPISRCIFLTFRSNIEYDLPTDYDSDENSTNEAEGILLDCANYCALFMQQWVDLWRDTLAVSSF